MSPAPSLLVTVDTEGDDEWAFRRKPANGNIGCLGDFEAALARTGCRSTYLVTYTVAQDDRAAEILRGYRDTRGSEIGAHCHAWNTPPEAAMHSTNQRRN